MAFNLICSCVLRIKSKDKKIHRKNCLMRRCFFRKYYDDVKVAVYIYSILFFVAKLNQRIVMMHVDTSMIKDDREKIS